MAKKEEKTEEKPSKDDGETKYPDVVEQFAEVLKHYKVRKGVEPENIAAHILETGSENVFDNPAELQKALAEWSDEIAPTYRAKILDRWFKSRRIPIPPEVLTEMENPTEKDKEKETEAKYAVDLDTGLIRAAAKDEKPLTWAEAERLSARIKKERGNDKGESPFYQDENGRWQINPKIKKTAEVVLAYQTIQRQQETGQPVDPIEAFSQQAERWARVKEALGISSSSSGDIRVAELQKQLADLTTQIQTLKDQQFKDQITSLSNTIKELSTELSNIKTEMGQGKTAETRWGLFSKALDKVDSQMTGLRGDVRTAIMIQRKGGAALPELSQEERGKIGQKIKKAVQEEQASKQLESELWSDL
jgi:hypothetical protein